MLNFTITTNQLQTADKTREIYANLKFQNVTKALSIKECKNCAVDVLSSHVTRVEVRVGKMAATVRYLLL